MNTPIDSTHLLATRVRERVARGAGDWEEVLTEEMALHPIFAPRVRLRGLVSGFYVMPLNFMGLGLVRPDKHCDPYLNFQFRFCDSISTIAAWLQAKPMRCRSSFHGAVERATFTPESIRPELDAGCQNCLRQTRPLARPHCRLSIQTARRPTSRKCCSV